MLKQIWGSGRAVSLDELSNNGHLGKTASQFCKSYNLKYELKSGLECPACGRSFKYLDNNTYLVCSCGNQINTHKTDNLNIFRFTPDFDEIVNQIAKALKEKLYERDDRQPYAPIEYLKEVGVVKKDSKPLLRLFLATKKIDLDVISKLWVRLISQKEYGAVIHPSITKEARDFVDLTATSVPILFCNLESIEDPEFTNQFDAFHSFREETDRRFEHFKSLGLFNDLSNLTYENDLSLNLETLARFGGERFEERAIPLLHTLGAPKELSKRPFVPDGILLLPRGYWIIDAKSSNKGFEFDVSERDKAIRYITNLERESGPHETDMSFHGEIILALTSHITSELIYKVNDQYASSGLKSSIVILSFEGVQWLWNQSRLKPEYWHMFNKERDTDDLMELKPIIRNRLDKSDLGWEFATTKVRLVSENAIRALWEYVFQRNRYYGYSARHPDYIATSIVQQTFVDNYARLKT